MRFQRRRNLDGITVVDWRRMGDRDDLNHDPVLDHLPRGDDRTWPVFGTFLDASAVLPRHKFA
jgi:hypothetical protein